MFIANHPGVYVQEIPTLPPSIAPVATAIPVFIGYTEKSPTKSPTNSPTPVRIETMLDYVNLFGGPCKKGFTVTVDENPPSGPSPGIKADSVANDSSDNFLMYYGLSLYFQNGGGSCYIISVGDYTATPAKDDFDAALTVLEKEDEPTLIVLLDATTLSSKADYYTLCQSGLSQCQKLGDRFLLIDIPDKDTASFRNSIGTNYLAYGAVYYPYLYTTLNFGYDESNVTITDQSAIFSWSPDDKGFTVLFNGTNKDSPNVSISIPQSSPPTACSFDTATTAGILSITLPSASTNVKDFLTAWNKWKSTPGNCPNGFDIASPTPQSTNNVSTTDKSTSLTNVTPTLFAGSSGTNGFNVTYIGIFSDKPAVTISNATGYTFTLKPGELAITIPSGNSSPNANDLVSNWSSWKNTPGNNPNSFDIVTMGKGTDTVTTTAPTLSAGSFTLSILKSYKTALYNQIKTVLANKTVTLPPSPAIAGVYASVDRDRGVWKAPANVSLNSVIGPTIKISDADQDDLNIDPTAGKSINAIRSFTGKGTLVWGARTLAGNDNEWRYVPVRRLFIFIEESTRKATSFAVFEPNDATTWLKVKAMIESFLYGLWQQGALAGSKPEQAYFVSVGLGKTMTPQDILEGRMIVTIGVAAVRPAEFIILTFSHKLQEA